MSSSGVSDGGSTGGVHRSGFTYSIDKLKERLLVLFQSSRREGATASKRDHPLMEDLDRVLEEEDLSKTTSFLERLRIRMSASRGQHSADALDERSSRDILIKLKETVSKLKDFLSNMKEAVEKAFHLEVRKSPSLYKDTDLSNWVHNIIQQGSFQSSDTYGLSIRQLEKIIKICSDMVDSVDEDAVLSQDDAKEVKSCQNALIKLQERLTSVIEGRMADVVSGASKAAEFVTTTVFQSKQVVLPVGTSPVFRSIMSSMSQCESQQDIDDIMQEINGLSLSQRKELISICNIVMKQSKISEKDTGVRAANGDPIATEAQLLLDIKYTCLLLNIMHSDSLHGQDATFQEYGKYFIDLIYNRIMDISESEIGKEEVSGLIVRLTDKQVEQLIKYLDHEVGTTRRKVMDKKVVSASEKVQMARVLSALRAAKPNVLHMPVIVSGKYRDIEQVLKEMEDCLPVIDRIMGKVIAEVRTECDDLTLDQLILVAEEFRQECNLETTTMMPRERIIVLANLDAIILERVSNGESSKHGGPSSTLTRAQRSSTSEGSLYGVSPESSYVRGNIYIEYLLTMLRAETRNLYEVNKIIKGLVDDEIIDISEELDEDISMLDAFDGAMSEGDTTTLNHKIELQELLQNEKNLRGL